MLCKERCKKRESAEAEAPACSASRWEGLCLIDAPLLALERKLPRSPPYSRPTSDEPSELDADMSDVFDAHDTPPSPSSPGPPPRPESAPPLPAEGPSSHEPSVTTRCRPAADPAPEPHLPCRRRRRPCRRHSAGSPRSSQVGRAPWAARARRGRRHRTRPRAGPPPRLTASASRAGCCRGLSLQQSRIVPRPHVLYNTLQHPLQSTALQRVLASLGLLALLLGHTDWIRW